ERQAKADARGYDRSRRWAKHLAQCHAGLDVGDLASHVAGGAAHHDEGEGRDGAHEAQQHARGQHLGQRPRRRHPEEPEPLEACTAMKPRLGSMCSPSRPEIGAVSTVINGLMPRIQPVQRRVAAGSRLDIFWMWKGRLTYTN